MSRIGFIGAMLSVCLLSTIVEIAIAAGDNGQRAGDCCGRSGETAHPASPEGEASCKYCGMDREKFAHSRMLVEYDDGTAVGTCSIHCLAVELTNAIDKAPKTIGVGDYGNRKLIDAETAYWVIGGDKTGVMSSRAKWAFESKTDAEVFIAANGGIPATFEAALKAAYEDLYKDTRMIRDRRKMNRMKHMEQK